MVVFIDSNLAGKENLAMAKAGGFENFNQHSVKWLGPLAADRCLGVSPKGNLAGGETPPPTVWSETLQLLGTSAQWTTLPSMIAPWG
jgi:hypothetical protein